MAAANTMPPFTKLSADLLICLRFLSRLPVPETARERSLGAAGFATAAAMAPLAGLVMGAPAALALVVTLLVGLPPPVAAVSALAVLTAVTGALHEDGLADCADGFGGGRTRERKLAIMRDSAIGTYGATAVGFSLLLRATALSAAILQHRGMAALLVAAIVSRGACLIPLALLPAAREDGAGAAAGLTSRTVLTACTLGTALAIAISGRIGGVAVLLAAGGALAVTELARRQIGGQTGDVAGAAQQVAETAALLAFAAGAPQTVPVSLAGWL